MTTDRRVLVLENLPNLLDNYAYFLRDAGFEVHEAPTLPRAFDLLDRFAFAACVVDLMLNDPEIHDTFDGTFVLDACEALGEGTKCLIVSAQPQPELAASLALRYGPFGYINKSEVVSGGAGVLVSAVESACAAWSGLPGGVTSDIYAQLFGRGGEESAIAESNLLHALSPRGGPVAFRKAASLVLRPLLPLFPSTSGSHAWKRIDQGLGLQKFFWSKGLGCAITLTAEPETGPILEEKDAAFSAATVGVQFVAQKIDGFERNAFTGRIPESVRTAKHED